MEKWFCIWDDFANPKIGLNTIADATEDKKRKLKLTKY
jgi:hypothetical protein